jgi:BMFP domain-containing protein YqiC
MPETGSASRDDLLERGAGASFERLPVPDPTRLTTQLVDRAIANFREVIEVRLAELDKAVVLAADQVSKLPADAAAKVEELRADLERQMKALRELIMSQIDKIRDVDAERFDAVNTRFLERDSRTEQAALESRISLDAALAAAKEAVSEQNKANAAAIGKSETATQKQIDAMVQLMTTSNKSLEDKISDIKTRLDRGEGHDTGSTEARADKRFDIGAVIQAIAVMATIVGLIIVAFHK